MHVKMFLVIVYYMSVPLSESWSRQAELRAKNSKSDNPYREQSDSIVYRDCEYNVTRTIDLQANPIYRVLTRDTNKYMLYTRENPEHPYNLYENIAGSDYNSADQTIFVVHGWKGNWKSKLNPAIRDAFLNVIYANVIVVDWSSLASVDYVSATRSAPRVGQFLGQFLQSLHVEAGASYSTMHLVGFGLGAHVVGNAANYLLPSGRVARITGLDPAGPLWDKNSRRLKAKDAVYVEVIHTDGNMLGTTSQCGDVDFYPNGGRTQPGCSSNASDSCSHMRSWQLFAATIKSNHLIGRRCDTEGAFGLNMCYHEYLPMGNDDLLKNASGVYRLTTGSKYPYPQLF